MSDNQDPLDIFRPQEEPPLPSPEEEEQAWQRLQHAIAAERHSKRSLSSQRRWLLPASAAIVAAVVALSLAVSPNPAQAFLSEIAQAARTASPLEIPEGSFIYSESESTDLVLRPGVELGIETEFVAYLQPLARQVWRQTLTNFYQIETTLGQPQFFDPTIEAAYNSLGLHRTDRIGEAVTRRLTEVVDPLVETAWPIQPSQLRQAMEAYALKGGDERPTEAQLLDLAADILQETNPAPELRSAILQVLAQLPLEFYGRGTQGAVTIGVTYPAPLQTRDTVTLSRRGELLARTTTLLQADNRLGVPAGTVVSQARFEPPRITTNLPDQDTS